jgi:hypothetical protein
MLFIVTDMDLNGNSGQDDAGVEDDHIGQEDPRNQAILVKKTSCAGLLQGRHPRFRSVVGHKEAPV